MTQKATDWSRQKMVFVMVLVLIVAALWIKASNASDSAETSIHCHNEFVLHGAYPPGC